MFTHLQEPGIQRLDHQRLADGQVDMTWGPLSRRVCKRFDGEVGRMGKRYQDTTIDNNFPINLEI